MFSSQPTENNQSSSDTPSSRKLMLMPMTLREANDFVEQFHRHSSRTSRDGGRFAIGASNGAELLGVAIVGRPLARLLNDSYTAEVTRLCVKPGLPTRNNVCSFLYGRCWRIWQGMGGRRLVTYTLQTESGASLRGAGWKIAGESEPHKNGWQSTGRERDWQPIYGQQKFRWERCCLENISESEERTTALNPGGAEG